MTSTAEATGVLARGPAERRHVYLTFDDGPDPAWTPRILDALGEAGLVAAFFTIGKLARVAGAVVRRAASEGHLIGNHSWSHRHPWTMSPEAARREVRDGATALADVAGQAPAFYRPPHGRLRRCMVEEARAGGQRVVLWSRSAVDWGPLGYAAGIQWRLARVAAGDIVLMHDGGRGINRPDQLMRALPEFLSRLRRQHLTSASLSEL
ncbi:MAG TPA: polysaccharide deacetylase family protein [Burkholderiales bacterium]|jgi:peptidoglycan/xylan/chitin deacetylase (PgdA/CDA1 family)|nr:polysaccharide deacetylase family protein [Burkholderiales bacterium]